MWFEQLTGFKEESAQNVRNNLRIEGDTFISKINNKRFTFGKLEIPTLDQLKASSPKIESFKDNIQVAEVVGDVQILHCQIENSNALFQAASQFNLLEMVDPEISPELGIDGYEYDYTQGPACAIACGAGTIYRNYFVKIGDQIGQTRQTQIDCLGLIGETLQNKQLGLWKMQNGYALCDQNGLQAISKIISGFTTEQREHLKGQLKTGIQWNTEVTMSETKHKVSQIYSSALPVAYCRTESRYWEPFARVILEATYESTFYAALINLEQNHSNIVYLTLVGGGAFGNEEHWILESLQSTIRKFKHTPLDVRVVSYGQSNRRLLESIKEI